MLLQLSGSNGQKNAITRVDEDNTAVLSAIITKYKYDCIKIFLTHHSKWNTMIRFAEAVTQIRL